MLDTPCLALHKAQKESEPFDPEPEQVQPEFQPLTYCKTDDEHFQEVSQNDCYRDQHSVREPNIRPRDEIVEQGLGEPRQSGNQISDYHEDLNFGPVDYRQEIVSAQGRYVCQTCGVRLVEDTTLNPGPFRLTHTGLIDASPFPNPRNEKTKIALVGGYLRRVPLSHPEPVSASHRDQKVECFVSQTLDEIEA